MARLPRSCPECRASLASARALRNGNVRCPECDNVIAPKRDDEGADRSIRSKQDPDRLPVKRAKNLRETDDASDRPVRKSNRLLPVLIGGGVGLALVCLFLCGGGALLAAYFWPAKQTPVGPAIAQEQKLSEPLANPPVQVQFKENPPRIDPQPQTPLPPKEPIKPAPPVEPPAVGALPLDELKAASVFIKVRTPNLSGSGSGFVVRTQGDTAYVVTNHHVVTPPGKTAWLPANPQDAPALVRAAAFPPPGFPGPGIRGIGGINGIRGGIPVPPGFPGGMPVPPGGPFDGGIPDGGMPGDAGGPVELTVVFRSGTGAEEALKAVLVADDKDADLAVVKVSGVKDLPRPLEIGRRPKKLEETLAVVAFGFPFGSSLDPKQKNPAITVTKGAVSALRMDGGELTEVQLDLDLNPGNSGGPVVDEHGNLIGVAVAKIRNSKIGFAVPVHKLDRLLEGRVDAPTGLQTLAIQGQTEVRAVARISDPFAKLRSATLLYGLADQLKAPARGAEGWQGLVGAKSSALKIDEVNAVAVLALTPPAMGETRILVQASYQNAAGQTFYSEPKTLSLGAPGAPPAQPPQRGPTPTGPATGEDLTKALSDLASDDETKRQQAAEWLAKFPPNERRKEIVQGLHLLLKSADPLTRIAGVKALAVYSSKEIPPAVVKLLDDEVLTVRQAVLHVMKDRPDARFAEAVARRLPTDGGLVAEVLKAIGLAGENVVLPYLTDKNPQARSLAFAVIKEIGAMASVGPLQQVIQTNGPDAGQARNVLQSVQERVPLAKGDWEAALTDVKFGDAGRRIGAVRRIAATPPIADRRAEVVALMESIIGDKSEEIRVAAAKALGRWGGKDSIPALAKQVVVGLDVGGHAAILAVLAEMNDEAAAAVIAKRWLDIFDRGNATKALKAMKPPLADKAALSLLPNANEFVKMDVCRMLTEVGGRESIGPLEQLVNDKNVFYSGLAGQALAAVKARMEDSETK
jgi:S1-C subfamily serine protease/HEAT repeat protein